MNLLFAVSFLAIAITPILGLLALAVLTSFIIARRAGHVAAARDESAQSQHGIQKRDRELQVDFADSIETGVPIDRAISQYCASRAELLPGANLDTPHAWTTEDCKRTHQRQLQAAVHEINRGWLLPAVCGTVVIVGLVVVTCGILYQFSSSVGDAASSSPPLGETFGPQDYTSTPPFGAVPVPSLPPSIPTISPNPVPGMPAESQSALPIPVESDADDTHTDPGHTETELPAIPPATSTPDDSEADSLPFPNNSQG